MERSQNVPQSRAASHVANQAEVLTHTDHRFGRRELATLAALAEAFVPGVTTDDYQRRGRLAADVLTTHADLDDLRLLRLAIRALDFPLANLLSGGGATPFSRMPAARRDRLLLRMATSVIPQRRTAYQALKRISSFIGWADPGESAGGNPLWAEIGYRPADLVPAPRSAISPLQVERSPAADRLELEADAVVVGSGAGGGVIAARLAAAGRAVLVVEAGPHVPESEMSSLEGEGFRRLYLDQATTATHDLGITILAGSGLGGGTTINWTTCLAPPEWLRAAWAADHGLDGFDGAQTDADIARLRAELDLQAPTIIPPKDQAILDGAAALGWEAAPTERNAGPCTDCGSCGFGCRAGVKRSGLRAHLATAASHGARFLVEAPVERVEIAGDRATGVIGTLTNADGRPGRPFRVRAAQVVVAAGALRTPLLLERSGVAHPGLGSNLRLHPVVAVAARMPDPVEMWTGPSQAARSLQFSQQGPAAPDGVGPAHGGFVIESAPPHPGLAASAFPWEGGAATRASMRSLRFQAPLLALIKDLDGGTVSWSRQGRARIRYRLGGAAVGTARRALVELSRLGRAAGATELMTVATPTDRISLAEVSDATWHAFLARQASADLRPNRTSLFSAHQMGTARAGAEPSGHPCDPSGRVRRDVRGTLVSGLYVADSSLFPTASGVNPMLTVMTLAERTARAVLGD